MPSSDKALHDLSPVLVVAMHDITVSATNRTPLTRVAMLSSVGPPLSQRTHKADDGMAECLAPRLRMSGCRWDSPLLLLVLLTQA